jgi:hypothetical protein
MSLSVVSDKKEVSYEIPKEWFKHSSTVSMIIIAVINIADTNTQTGPSFLISYANEH